MKSQKLYSINAVNSPPAIPKRTLRRHLNADTLLQRVREDFQKVPDARADNRHREEPENLHSIFDITIIPCDSQMRTLLDPLELASLRAPFPSVFRQVQRGKDFEKMAFFDDHYLLSGDGTGFYSSEKVSRPIAWVRKTRMAPSFIISRCMQHPLSIPTAKWLSRSFLK